jgi:hypothetical protein
VKIMTQRDYIKNLVDKVKYGLWIDNNFSWLNSSWNEQQLFINKSVDLTITLEANCYEGLIVQKMTVKNLLNVNRKIKLFFSQGNKNKINDGVTFFAPTLQAIVRGQNNQFLLINGMFQQRGIVQYSTNGNENHLLNEGKISFQPFSANPSSSIFSLEGDIGANQEHIAYFWICLGSEDEVIKSNASVQLNLTNNSLNTYLCKL